MAVNHSIYGGLVQLSGNRVEIEVLNDDLKGESPRALLKAISTDGAVAGGPFIDSKPWIIQSDESGKAIFDFSEYLDAPTQYDFTHPYGNAFAVKHPLRAFDLKILAGASYIDDVPASATFGKKIEAWQNEANAVPIRILKGGMSQQRQSQYKESGLNFYQDFIQGAKFLTYRPNNQRIAWNQPVRLWYMTPETFSVTQTLMVEWITAAGGTEQLEIQVDMDPDGLYEFILDPPKLGIAPDARQFTVYFSDGQTQVVEQRTFIIDPKYYENNTFMFFTNSLGGIDDVWFTGAVKLLLNTDGETGIQALDRNATTKDRSVVVTGKTGSRKWSIFPGNRQNIAEIEYLQDLLYSKHIWLVWNNQIVPVNLENGEFELTGTMRDLIINDELELVFIEANKNNYY